MSRKQIICVVTIGTLLCVTAFTIVMAREMQNEETSVLSFTTDYPSIVIPEQDIIHAPVIIMQNGAQHAVIIQESSPAPQMIQNQDVVVAEHLTPHQELAREVFELTNQERVSRGLPELMYDYELQGAADTRAREISTFFSHTRPDGSSCHDIIEKDYSVAGENLILASRQIATAQGMMEEWMNSPGHRANILLEYFNRMAVGVYEKDDTVFCTQIFIG